MTDYQIPQKSEQITDYQITQKFEQITLKSEQITRLLIQLHFLGNNVVWLQVVCPSMKISDDVIYGRPLPACCLACFLCRLWFLFTFLPSLEYRKDKCEPITGCSAENIISAVCHILLETELHKYLDRVTLKMQRCKNFMWLGKGFFYYPCKIKVLKIWMILTQFLQT